MKTTLRLLCLLLPLPAMAGPLPDLGGRVVTVAVENAYPPLQFLTLKAWPWAGNMTP